MGYGAKSTDIKDISQLGIGIHNVKLSNVSKESFSDKNKKEWNVLDFLFEGDNGQFTIRLFNPDEDSDEKRKEKNQEYYSNLISYILKKIKNVEVIVPSVSSFEELKNWTIAQLGNGYSTVPLIIKIIGNVYNNKANIQITKYFGWLERKDSGKLPSFSFNEEQGNKEYINFINKKNKDTEEAYEKTKEDDEPVF